MGFVNNTHMAHYIPPTLFHIVTGTVTLVAGQVANTICAHIAATDEASVVTIPITVPSNSSDQKGAKLISVEIDFEITDAACDAVDALIHLVTRGANGSVATVSAPAFTYDTGNDTAAERYAVDEHKMVLTLTTPIWVDDDQYVLVQITFDKAATSEVDLYAAVANYTLRM